MCLCYVFVHLYYCEYNKGNIGPLQYDFVYLCMIIIPPPTYVNKTLIYINMTFIGIGLSRDIPLSLILVILVIADV